MTKDQKFKRIESCYQDLLTDLVLKVETRSNFEKTPQILLNLLSPPSGDHDR